MWHNSVLAETLLRDVALVLEAVQPQEWKLCRICKSYQAPRPIFRQLNALANLLDLYLEQSSELLIIFARRINQIEYSLRPIYLLDLADFLYLFLITNYSHVSYSPYLQLA